MLILESPFGFGTKKLYTKETQMYNVKILIQEKLSLLKARVVIAENI